ncbi:MAG: hypothetical protein V3V15_00675 [Sphingorhabdus sp.]
MKHSIRHNPFLCQLLGLLPGSKVKDYQHRDWHSATFEGQKVTAILRVSRAADEKQLADFIAQIGEIQFDLAGQFVADISAFQPGNDGRCRLIEVTALILKE